MSWPNDPAEPGMPPPGSSWSPGQPDPRLQWPSGDQATPPPTPPQPQRPGTFAPGQDNVLPNAPYGATDEAVHTMSFGVSDVLHAVNNAARDWLKGNGYDYSDQFQYIKRGREQYEAEHPFLSTAASVLGGAAYAPAEAGTTFATRAAPVVTDAAESLGRRMLQGGVVGATTGGVTGATNNAYATPDQSLAARAGEHAATGLVTGAGLGAAIPPVTAAASNLVGRFASGVYRFFNQGETPGPVGTAVGNLMPNIVSNPTSLAADKLRAWTTKDIESGLPDYSMSDARLAGNAPTSLADIYPSVRRGVGDLYNRDTAAAPYIETTLNQRDQEARQRLISGLDKTAGTGPETFEADRILQAKQRANAKPAYDNAYLQAPPNPDWFQPGGSVNTLLSRPSMTDAMGRARSIAAEEGRDPNSLGITFDADGNAKFVGVPSWQTLDYVKRGLDDVIGAYPRNPLTGKPILDTRGRAVVDTRSDFLGLLDKANPQYAAARAVYNGDQAARDALEQGSHILSPGMSAAENQDIYSRLTPGDQELFRLGGTNALRLKIRSAPDSADETKGIANSDEQRDKLKLLFDPKSNNYQTFLDQVNEERNLFNTKTNLIGNSATASRIGSSVANAPAHPLTAAIPAALVAGGAVGPAAAVKAGATALAVPAIRQLAENFANRWTGNSPLMQQALASLALAPGAAGRQALSLLTRDLSRPIAPGYLPGVIGGTATLQNGPNPYISGLLAPQQ